MAEASRLLLLANIETVEPGAGLRLVLFDYAVAKGKRQSAKKAKDVVDVLPCWKKSFCPGMDSAGIQRGYSGDRAQLQAGSSKVLRQGRDGESQGDRETGESSLGRWERYRHVLMPHIIAISVSVGVPGNPIQLPAARTFA